MLANHSNFLNSGLRLAVPSPGAACSSASSRPEPRRYLQLVENTRDGAATRQRVLATLGRVDDPETNGKLDALLQSGARFSETALLISSLQAGTLETSATTRIGAPLIFGRLWQQTGCAAVIERLGRRPRLRLLAGACDLRQRAAPAWWCPAPTEPAMPGWRRTI